MKEVLKIEKIGKTYQAKNGKIDVPPIWKFEICNPRFMNIGIIATIPKKNAPARVTLESTFEI